jgi:hypothetical protein
MGVTEVELKIGDLLTADTGVTDLLTSGAASIFNDSRIPDQNLDKSLINYYQASINEAFQIYTEFDLLIHCRTLDFPDSSDLRDAVVVALNRYVVTGFSFVCSSLPIISPQDNTDFYNAPIQVRAKNK